jgi:hypothetical protein
MHSTITTLKLKIQEFDSGHMEIAIERVIRDKEPSQRTFAPISGNAAIRCRVACWKGRAKRVGTIATPSLSRLKYGISS